MADWVWVESPSTSIDEQAQLRTAQFGDGFEQSAPDGINFLKQSWSLQFDEVDDAEGDLMVAFLRENLGLSFNYWPLWATAAVKVRCDAWRRTLGTKVATSTISATFRRVYEP